MHSHSRGLLCEHLPQQDKRAGQVCVRSRVDASDAPIVVRVGLLEI